MKNIVKLLAITVLVAVIIACDTSGGDDDVDGGGHWLIYGQTTYVAKDGKVDESYGYDAYISYDWIAYRYRNETDYEEEYTTVSQRRAYENGTFSEHHYTRNGQTSHSTTETLSMTFPHGYQDEEYGWLSTVSSSGISSTTSSYDSASGLTSSQTTVSSGGTTATYYSIQLLIDSGGIKTYKYNPVGSNWYNIIKIQNGRTLETSYYDENSLLIYTTTYIQPDNAEIRAKLPNFTLYSTQYYSSSYSINSSYQTADVTNPSDTSFEIRVKTFNDGILNSQTNYHYYTEKFLNELHTPPANLIDDEGTIYKTERWGDYLYYEKNGEITIYQYTRDRRVGGNATIPAQINGKPVTIIGGNTFECCYKLTSVTIPDTVTKIEGWAFQACWSLTNVIIPASVTSIGEVGRWPFNLCNSLSSVTFQGTIAEENLRGFYYGSLRNKYLAEGPGTYTTEDAIEWTKQ